MSNQENIPSLPTFSLTSPEYSYSCSEFPWKDAVGYNRRLLTFTPQSYFSKPLLLSPLICARFGWSCIHTNTDTSTTATANATATDNASSSVIQCEKCKAVISIQFHEELSPSSKRELVRIYRELLATRHQDTCSYSSDAKRWLIMANDDDNENDCKKDGEKFVVPPYLLPMSFEYSILEDQSRTGFITREFISREVQKIIYGVQRKNMKSLEIGLNCNHGDDGVSCWNVNVVEAKIRDICGIDITRDWKAHLRSLLHIDNDDSSNDISDNGNNNASSGGSWAGIGIGIGGGDGKDEEKEFSVDLYSQAILLALFGWRMDSASFASNQSLTERTNDASQPFTAPFTAITSPTADTETENESENDIKQQIRVTCPLCMNFCTITSSTSSTSSDPSTPGVLPSQSPPSKRQRTDNAGNGKNGDSVQKVSFDLIACHRHFCPYVTGFHKEADRGWMRNSNGVDGDDDARNGVKARTKNGCVGFGTSRPCWEIVLSALARMSGDGGTQEDEMDTVERSSCRRRSDDKDCLDPAKSKQMYEQIRKALREHSSPMLRKSPAVAHC